MTDFLNRFGAITGTTLYSADTLDFGPIDDRAPMHTHRTGEAPEETVIFRASGVGSSVTVVAKLQDSADNTTFTDLVTAQGVAGPVGDFAFIPFPKSHKRYVRAAIGTALGTSGGTVTARLEPGVSPKL